MKLNQRNTQAHTKHTKKDLINSLMLSQVNPRDGFGVKNIFFPSDHYRSINSVLQC